ncbi:ROK family transcriptional regulator [Ktedonosporobacter rubrisoli]|nr:ROK family transcriptional regulator [Ktedonosporobacter rubrisoli]
MLSLASDQHNISNKRLALQIICEVGPLSRAEIARRLRLSRPTASRIVDALEQAGLITSVGKSQPTGGRLGDLYSFREDAGCVLALELGTREARLAMAQLTGKIVTRATRVLELEARENVLPQVSLFINDTLNGLGKMRPKLLAMGVAVPGVVHLQATPDYIDAAKIFHGLNNRPLRQELEQLFQVPIAMDNDVNLAAVGESQYGCAQGQRNVVYLFVGRGIGAGLILNGTLFRGNTEAAGEVGNIVVDRANLYQRFGTRGSLEALASLDRLAEIADTASLPDGSLEDFCRSAFASAEQARALLGPLNEYLAAAIINMVATLDPGVVVLGGDLFELPYARELFMQPIEELLLPHVGKAARLEISQLQGDATLYGALQAAIDIALNVGAAGGHV